MPLCSTPAGPRGTGAGVALRERWAAAPQDMRTPTRQTRLWAELDLTLEESIELDSELKQRYCQMDLK